MGRSGKSLVSVVIIGAALLFAQSAYSQGKRNLLAPEASSGPRPSGGGVRIVYAPPKIIRTTERVIQTTFTVATQPGATIVLSGKKVYRKDADAKGTVVFEGIPAGVYQLEASKEGFATVKAKDINIVAQKTQATSLFPSQISYKVTISTDIKGGGDIRFAPANYLGRNPDGSIRSEQLGPYCVAKIQPDGKAEISDLKKSYYDIDIRPDSLEYAATFSGIDLTKSVDDDESPDSAILKTYSLQVEKNRSTETFSTTWIPSDWDMPSAWRLEDRRMKVKTDGIAMPANSRYRYYTNFEMVANVRIRDGGSAGFVFRQEDPQNYYLFQISGERGENPGTAQLFVVENGRRQQLNSSFAGGFAKTLASDDGFEISIVGDDTGFTVWITDANAAKPATLARFPDTFKTFKKGAVGIAGSPKSNFEVKTFQVCTPSCPK